MKDAHEVIATFLSTISRFWSIPTFLTAKAR